MKKDLIIVGLAIAFTFLLKAYGEQNKELKSTQSQLNNVVSQNIDKDERLSHVGDSIKAIEWKKCNSKKQGDE